MRLIKRKRAAIAVLIGFLLLGSFGGWQWWRASQQKAEAAARQAHLVAELEKLESSAAVAQPSLQDVRELKKAFLTDFTAALAIRPGHTPERDALLDRGVHYLDRVRASSPTDPDLGLEMADGYQQLGLLQERTAEGKNRQAAVGTYQKGAEVLGNVSAQHPDNAAAKQRLARLNERIRDLQNGGAPAQPPANAEEKPPAMTPPPPEPAPVTPVAASKPAVQPPVKVAQKAAVPAPPPPPVEVPAAAPPAATPSVPPAEMADIEDRMANATSKVEIAEQTIEPVRQSLARTGQTLNPDISSAMVSMRSRLARAKREIAAGDVAAAREDLAAADAFAAKVLKSVGR